MNIKEFIKSHFDFKLYGSAVFAIICFLLITPCSLYLPQNYGYENGPIENIQMIILLIIFIFCLRAKENKKFYIFLSLVITVIALREINCGRTLFFAIPGQENEFYKWSEIKYGYLAHPLFGLYILLVAFYFIKNKLYIPLRNYITKYTIPVYNTVFLIIGLMLGLYADKNTNNFVFEEMAELLLYISLAGIVFYYGFIKNKD